MKNPEPDTIVRRFIEGDLSEEEVQDALHHIADDAEARSLLQFELRMTQDLAASRSARPSPEFSARTMEQVAEVGAAEPSLRDRLQRWWRGLTRPLITIPVRPAYALVLFALVIGVGTLAWPLPAPKTPETSLKNARSRATVQQATASSTQQAETVWTRFVYMDDDADSVAVAGDFSQWKPIPLSPRTVNGRTVWTGLVPVQQGEHEYQFVINGEKWVTDPLAPIKHDDGFGAKNAVLKL